MTISKLEGDENPFQTIKRRSRYKRISRCKSDKRRKNDLRILSNGVYIHRVFVLNISSCFEYNPSFINPCIGNCIWLYYPSSCKSNQNTFSLFIIYKVINIFKIQYHIQRRHCFINLFFCSWFKKYYHFLPHIDFKKISFWIERIIFFYFMNMIQFKLYIRLFL